jgi:outer membrane receptor protein involved in Fe transport
MDSVTAGMLKYRYPHLLKADVDFILYKKYHLGSSLQYYSYLTRIDQAFLAFIPGVDEYRMATRNKDTWIWDLRAGYDLNRNIGFSFLVKNITNTYYSFRPSRPAPPRSYAIQMVVNFGGGKQKTTALPSNTNM